jgi:hypothetical protein
MMKRKKKNQAVPKQQEVPTKMSEILLNYAWNFAIDGHSDLKQRQHFMNVACSAWNFSLMSDEDCQRAISNFVDNMRAAGGVDADEANMQALTNDLNALVAFKREHYPTVNKLVVSAVLSDIGDKVNCQATTGDYETFVKAKLAK